MVSNTASTRVAGTLGKRITRDILVAFGLGVPAGYLWWYSYHVPQAKKRDAWYADYAAKKAAEDDE